MKSLIIKSAKWTLAIMIALAFKYSALYVYSAFNFKQAAKASSDYSQLQASYRSKHLLETRPEYWVWDFIVYN